MQRRHTPSMTDADEGAAMTGSARRATVLLIAAGCGIVGAASASGTPSPPATAFSAALQLTAPFPYGLVQAEPNIKALPDGSLAVMAPASSPLGCELWTLPAGAQSATFHTPPDAGVGGGDCDLAYLPATTAAPHGTLAYSSLSLGSLTVGSSTDSGATFTTPNPYGSTVPLVDRQWMATDGTTIYMSYHLVVSNTIAVAASTDGGQTYTLRGTAIDTSRPPGRITSQERDHVSPPTVSSTRSTSDTASSKGAPR